MKHITLCNILIGIFCLCVFTACPLFSNNYGKPFEPYFPVDKVWTSDVTSKISYCFPTQDGQYLYLTAASRWYDYEAPSTFTIEKIDLNDGSPVWTSKPVSGRDESIVCLASPYLFIYIGSGIMRCFSEDDGSLLASIRLNASGGEDNTPSFQYIAYANGTIYWGTTHHSTSQEPKGLVKLSIDQIDFSRPPGEYQTIIPQMVSPTGQCIWSCPIVDQDILYFLTNNPEYMDDTGHAILEAVDTKNDSVLWKQEVPSMQGIIKNPLLVHDDTLFVIDSSMAAFDKNTGAEKYLYDTTKMDLSKEFYRGGSTQLAGITYYEGRLYYVNTMHSATPSFGKIPWELVYNLVCLDAATGEVLWKNRPQGIFSSTGANPIVANGKAYFLTNCGIHVYEAESGGLIGVYPYVDNSGLDRVFSYNGTMIFRDCNGDADKAKLTAIRI